MIDIVFPKNNEQEYIDVAKKIGITKFIFTYHNKKDIPKQTYNFPYQNALLITPQQAATVPKNIIRIALGSRETLEAGVHVAYDFEQGSFDDHTHYRKSGLNQVHCALAKNNKVKIGLSVSSILSTSGQKQALILGRIMQNIMFCQKTNTPIKIASFATHPYQLRTPKDISALFANLGMHPKTTQSALLF